LTLIPLKKRNARTSAVIALSGVLILAGAVFAAAANDADVGLSHQVFQLESAGDLSAARSLLQRDPAHSDSVSAREYAAFLERHRDPEAADAFRRWASLESDSSLRKLALRQAVLLDFMQAQSTQLASDLAAYNSAGGTDLSAPHAGQSSRPYSTVIIPGPLSSFARMAALATDIPAEDLLSALARNIVTNGYEASGNELLQQTEYLRLLLRYVGQARELQAMATSSGKIVIPTCDSDETGNLLKVLGYRMRGSCGGDLVLETVNPTRAFLTIDSGFPLPQLEQDLRANHRFELAYGSTKVPVLYSADYWIAALGRSGQIAQGNFVEAFVSDPSLCRLYLGLSHLSRETAESLRRQAHPSKLKIYAHVLDFYGGMFQIQQGAAVVPGPPRVWASLVGTSPSNPGAFFEKLIATDDGWLASYFDVLSRLHGATADYLTQPERMRRFYEALRGRITSPGPARPVFRASTDLMLLTHSLRIDASGQPHIPGNIDVWRTLFLKHPNGKYDGKLTKSANSWHSSDDLLDALFALSRKSVENEPLKIFLALNDVDRHRTKPISADLAATLISHYRIYGAQYPVLAEAPQLSEASIKQYLDLMASTASMHDALLKSDMLGDEQSLIEIWRILCRQNSISPSAQDASFAKTIKPFETVKQTPELFDAARSSLDGLLASAGWPGTGSRQEALMELLVGKMSSGSASGVPAEAFARIFDAQHLISIDTLFRAADHLGKGNPDPKLIKALTEQLSRLEDEETVRGSLSGAERTTLVPGYWSERHVSQERKVNFEALAKGSEKKDARAALSPFLRDSLVGVLYCYYAPDGAQLLMANPLFVRSHDFIGPENAPAMWRTTQVGGSGWPESAGGRLTGSMISLPYALAEAEQNFLSPKREQALIWGDLVPQMIIDVTVNRWRTVSPEQVRWVSLHIERGRTLLAAAAMNPGVESKVVSVLREYQLPAYVERITDHLRAGDYSRAAAEVPPSVLYELACEISRDVSPDIAAEEITQMDGEHNPALSRAEISRAFGTPKPTLTHSYEPALLNLRTFPALMGYSSRILAESWESNNLFYAALADQAGISLTHLDAYVPEWNRAAIENIFATHLEDWPALLRSLDAVSQNVLQRSGPAAGGTGGSSN
jgi:hypothetical protein